MCCVKGLESENIESIYKSVSNEKKSNCYKTMDFNDWEPFFLVWETYQLTKKR